MDFVNPNNSHYITYRDLIAELAKKMTIRAARRIVSRLRENDCRTYDFSPSYTVGYRAIVGYIKSDSTYFVTPYIPLVLRSTI